MYSKLATVTLCAFVATIFVAAAACQATQDALDVPPPSITPALVNVTPSPTRTPIPTPTVRPTSTPSATATATATAPAATVTAPATATATSQQESTPTPDSTSTPTPTPQPPTRTELSVYTFIFDLGLNPRTAEFTNIAPMTWPDLSLGCGPRDGNTPAVAVDGYIFNVSADGNDYIFHVAEYDGEEIIADCTDVADIATMTLNPTRTFGLDLAQSVTFSRTDGEGGYVQLRVMTDASDIAAWTSALDTDLPIGNSAKCNTAYKLEFATPGGSQVIDFFCKDDWFRIGGQQPEWGATQGAMPPTILSLISPILADQPLPQVPEIDENDPLLPTPTPTPTATPAPRIINPTQDFRLNDAESLVFSRINADSGYDPVSIVEGAALAAWTNALDVDMRIGISELCDTVYRMEFRSDGSTHTIDFFCENDWYRIGGDQSEWAGTQGAMPHTILDLIAPILSAQPLPELPADSDE